MKSQRNDSKKLETAYLGGGCFWCLDAVYSRVKGVGKVTAGYAGGESINPSYEDVCTGTTGHAEVVKVEFNPKIITFDKILSIFFSVHDPTTLNRQGNDIGPQYRSLILYDTQDQKAAAEKIIKKLSKEKIYPDPVVTEVKPLEVFYTAEDYHQKYFQKNPEQAYCQTVIAPKVAKLRKTFSHVFRGQD